MRSRTEQTNGIMRVHAHRQQISTIEGTRSEQTNKQRERHAQTSKAPATNTEPEKRLTKVNAPLRITSHVQLKINSLFINSVLNAHHNLIDRIANKQNKPTSFLPATQNTTHYSKPKLTIEPTNLQIKTNHISSIRANKQN